mmetsp:Transcript_12056/g.18025  ORF Transcript_12056/g.18025 Transcript_12056/m.18025 type:complete len:120 (-) Transcript_12056:264-623(-)
MEIDRPQIETDIIRERRKLSEEKEKDSSPNNGDQISSDKTNQNSCSDKSGVQTNRSRCFQCRKKVGIAGGLECRCGYIFCGKHRYPEEHMCHFDFRERERDALKKTVTGGGNFAKVNAI